MPIKKPVSLNTGFHLATRLSVERGHLLIVIIGKREPKSMRYPMPNLHLVRMGRR
jgi:hypothetical protein